VPDKSDADVIVKLFDYSLRTKVWYNCLSTSLEEAQKIVKADERRKAPDLILQRLINEHQGEACQIRVERASPECAILIYPYIPGTHTPQQVDAWQQMLSMLKLLGTVHQAGYLHGDILPQNLLFAPTSDALSTIIDWDMAGLEHETPEYLDGYNRVNFDKIRHPAAEKGNVMKRAHDCYSMAQLIDLWFETGSVGSFADKLRKAESLDATLLATAPAEAALKANQPTATVIHRPLLPD
jgi:serine/threonine protein kinase